jgi:hypothetical protein
MNSRAVPCTSAHTKRAIRTGSSRRIEIIFCARLDESAEHHPVVGRMRDGELHVRPVHGVKADAAMPVLFPGIGEGLPELAEPFFPYRRQQ